MWRFRKKSQADKALAVMDDAVSIVASKWHYFQDQMPFKVGVPLHEQIAMFSAPMMEGLRNEFPVLKKSPDDVLFLFIIQGIEASGTHPRGHVFKAFGLDELGEEGK